MRYIIPHHRDRNIKKMLDRLVNVLAWSVAAAAVVVGTMKMMTILVLEAKVLSRRYRTLHLKKSEMPMSLI